MWKTLYLPMNTESNYDTIMQLPPMMTTNRVPITVFHASLLRLRELESHKFNASSVTSSHPVLVPLTWMA